MTAAVVENLVELDDLDSLVLNPADPMRIARTFIKRLFTSDGHRTLHHHRGEWRAWTGTHYLAMDDADIRAKMYRFLESAERPGQDGKTEPFKPTSARVSDALDALRAVANLPSDISAPAWLDDLPEIEPTELVPTANGLMHLPTLELLPLTPTFYGLNALDYPYRPDAPPPRQWLAFLDQLWPDDTESVTTLQELMGYSLTTDTSQQKIFLLCGPKRSGKGTIARVATALLGQANVTAPTLAGLGQNFGLQGLIGRQLAIISDARLGSRADQHAITERLLSISGEDGISVARKFKEDWTGKLPVRFLILTNELPRLADASGALASRFIVLTLTRSFYGREDRGLTTRLLTELPGILNWAIAGWQRLQERGYFLQPESARDAIDELHDLGSPVGAFVRDCCIVEPGRSVECSILFGRWRLWCEDQGRTQPGTQQTFGRDLRAAVPGLKVSQPRDGDKRHRVYEGIGIE